MYWLGELMEQIESPVSPVPQPSSMMDLENNIKENEWQMEELKLGTMKPFKNDLYDPNYPAFLTNEATDCKTTPA